MRKKRPQRNEYSRYRWKTLLKQAWRSLLTVALGGYAVLEAGSFFFDELDAYRTTFLWAILVAAVCYALIRGFLAQRALGDLHLELGGDRSVDIVVGVFSPTWIGSQMPRL